MDISISRIKVSHRQQALAIPTSANGYELFARFCHLAASAGVNLTFAGMGMDAHCPSSLCCFRFEDTDRLRSVLSCEPVLNRAGKFFNAVGIIDLFPHRHRINVLGIALETLCRCDIDCLGLATSISALSFVIDYSRMKMAATELSGCFELPDGFGLVGNCFE